jgi:hypothetical protein
VPLSEDLDRIDVMLRQLQVKWDMFFVGSEKKPPSELQQQVETLIKRHSNIEIRNNAERFRYQGLSARYSTFNELWQKRMRAREEGRVYGLHGIRAEQTPPTAPPRPVAAAPRPGAHPGEYRVGDPRQDNATVRALYQRFVEERTRGGEGPAPAFEAFSTLIEQQTSRLRKEKGAQAVDFRLETKNGKVSLKARLVK